MKWIVILIGALLLGLCKGQRIPPPPQSFLNSLNNPTQNISGSSINSQLFQSQQKVDELANIKDENIKKVLGELSALQTPSQRSDTMERVAQLVGSLYFVNYDQRKDHIFVQSRDSSSTFPPRLLSAVSDIQGEEVKALVLQKKLDVLHSADFAFLPLAMQYGFQEDVLRNLSGTKLAAVVKANPGDTVVAFKVSAALIDQHDQQIEFLQSLGPKLLPEVQRIIMRQLLDWWGDPHQWKDRELNLLISAGSPLLSFLPQSILQSLDDELADRFVTILGQTQDLDRGWWRKPMSLKKAWFELAKGARYFGSVHEWSFRRMQRLSFLLEGASPEDLQLIPPAPEIKGLVVKNHYTELQARVVFDVFYNKPPLSQEDLQEFQFHVLDLVPTQLQRFDFADSFGTLDEMFSILERQKDPAYPTVLQISYFMWPIINSTNSMVIAPPATWQKRELSQIGKLFFLLPKSVLAQLRPDILDWDSNILAAIRSNHLTKFQIWRITSQILTTVDDRFKPDYIFMIPSPFQKGIPSQNISQALLGSTTVRPEILRALIEETGEMLTSQKSVLLQRINNRISEPLIIRMMISSSNPNEMFNLISPKILNKNMAAIVKTIMEMPETGRFGITSVQVKLLPKPMLSLWLKWVRENAQVAQWTAEDLLGRSPMGATHELNLAILGLDCRDIENVDPWDVVAIIMQYRHELYSLRRFKPTLVFNPNLRFCVLQKFVEYLKQKNFLDGDNSDGRVLSKIDGGEMQAVGGEILSLIPTKTLESLDLGIRLSIIHEIGQLQMMELFSLVTLDNLHWYGKALFDDIVTAASTDPNNAAPASLGRKRRESEGEPAAKTENIPGEGPDNTSGTAANATTTEGPDSKNGTEANSTATDTGNSTDHGDHVKRLTEGTLRDLFNARDAETQAEPTPANDTATTEKPLDPQVTSPRSKLLVSFPHGINIEALNSMGNLLFYADNIFDNPWPRSLLKDVLESKTSIGEKTVCLSKQLRDKWFATLQEVYGSDTSTWNDFDLAAIGDLLIVVPEQELQRISTDSLGKALTPIMRQSAFAKKIDLPGEIKCIQFVKACANSLGMEGEDFMGQYKILMKRLFQAAQWEVNRVKTTQELIRDGVGRTGRIPRWAEHTLVKRQVPIVQGTGDMAFGGLAATPAAATTPTVAQTVPMAAPAYFPTMAYAPQMMQPYAMPMANPYMAQPMMYAPQPYMAYPAYTPQLMTQPMAFAPQTVFGQQAIQPAMTTQQIGIQPTTNTGSGATTSATPAGATAAAGGVAGGTGSFSGTSTVAQATPSGANANAFAGGGSFAPGTGTADLSQASANTLAARASGSQQQQTQTGFQEPQSGSTIPSQAPAGQLSATAPGQPQQAAPPQQQPPPGQQTPVVPSGPVGQPGQQPQTGPSNPPLQQQQQSAPTNPPPGQPLAGQMTPGQQQAPGQPQQVPGQQQQLPPTGAIPVVPPQSIPQQQQPVSGNLGVIPSQVPGSQPQQPIPGGTNLQGSQPPLNDLRARSLNLATLQLQDESHNSEISCHGIKAAGAAAIGLTIEDINKLSPGDLFDCVEPLGKIEWDEDTRSKILTMLKEKVDFSHEAINAITLLELGDLVTAFSAKEGNATTTPASANANTTDHSDISLIDLTLPQSLDVLSILGQEITEPNLLKALAEKFNQDNRIFPSFSEGIARPENLRIVVMALGNILCGLSDKIVNSIFETDATLFIDTSCVLGRLEGCSNEVLTTLATHAVRPSNYGPPRLWSQEDVETIGVVIAGLKPDHVSSIAEDAMQGLTPLAVKNMPQANLLSLTPDQLKHLSYNSARAFTQEQINNLSGAKSEALKSVVEIQPEIFETPAPVEPAKDNANLTEVLRSIPSEEDTGGIGGRSKGQETTTPPPTTTEETTTTAVPDTKPPGVTTISDTSSASQKSSSFALVSCYLSLSAFIIPVFRSMNI